jgi:2-haloacid dehalogenase
MLPTHHPYQLITFDVYTALFDVESSLIPIVQQALASDLEPLAFVRLWRRKQLDYALIDNSLAQGRSSFWSLTQRALDYSLSQFKAASTESSHQTLMQSWLHLQPWPEAFEVLNVIKTRGHPIGLLSNGDHSMLLSLKDRLPPVIDHVFASEQAGHYKPHPSVYALPLQLLHLNALDVLHVAGSATDVTGTKAAGLACAWSNRQRDRVTDRRYQPDYEFADLRGLLEIV